MAKKSEKEFFQALRKRGLRRKLAKSIASLEGNSRRAGAKGEQRATQAVEDLTTVVADIRKRVLRKDRSRSKAAAKAARTRARKATKRSTAAKQGGQTAARTRARKATKRSTAAKKGVQTRARVSRARAKATS